jgi:surface antigen
MGCAMKVITQQVRHQAVVIALLSLVLLLALVGCSQESIRADAAGSASTSTGGQPPIPDQSGGRVGKYLLTQVTGDPGQCTYYAELAWYTYSDRTPKGQARVATILGNGQDIAPNYAAAYGLPTTKVNPQPGALVSWTAAAMGEASYGHVAFVAAVGSDAHGSFYTVWEMNWGGPFITHSRTIHLPDPRDPTFVNPPQPVDPIAKAKQTFGANSWWIGS